jgi:cell division protein FtsW
VGLVVLGLLMVYSSSFALGLQAFGDAHYFVARQAGFAVLGLGTMLILMRIDYLWLRNISPLLMLAAIVALMAVLVPGVGVARPARATTSRASHWASCRS